MDKVTLFNEPILRETTACTPDGCVFCHWVYRGGNEDLDCMLDERTILKDTDPNMNTKLGQVPFWCKLRDKPVYVYTQELNNRAEEQTDEGNAENQER